MISKMNELKSKDEFEEWKPIKTLDMAKDYTKYNVEGLGENLNKRQLIFTVVKDWAAKNKPSLEDMQNTFPDEIQG